tara:strand:- start:516 stop:764 length:249 start_codon:yes stop_codon:yes gene_type:complete
VPRYQYSCTACKKESTISHLSDETVTECPACNEKETLLKVVTNFSTSRATKQKHKVGKITEDFIKEARVDLKKQQNTLDKGR